MTIRRYLLFVTVMFFLDWLLGALQANSLISRWWFLAFNFPFGLPFVWIESNWVGTHYEVAGQNVNEIGSMIAWLFSVAGQALMYSILFSMLRKRKAAATNDNIRKHSARQTPQY
jgi:hypothetical protein